MECTLPADQGVLGKPRWKWVAKVKGTGIPREPSEAIQLQSSRMGQLSRDGLKGLLAPVSAQVRQIERRAALPALGLNNARSDQNGQGDSSVKVHAQIYLCIHMYTEPQQDNDEDALLIRHP